MAETIDIQIKTNAAEVAGSFKDLKTEMEDTNDLSKEYTDTVNDLVDAEHKLYIENTNVRLTSVDVNHSFKDLVKNSNDINKGFGQAIEQLQTINSDKGLKGTTDIIAKANISEAVSALGPLPGTLGQVTQGIKAVGTALKASLGPWGIAAAAISALIPILINVKKKHDEARQAARDHAAAEAENWRNIKESARQAADNYRELFNIDTSIRDMGDQQAAAWQREFDSTLAGLKNGTKDLNDVITRYEKQIASFRNRLTNDANSETGWTQAEIDQYEKMFDAMIKKYRDYLDNREAAAAQARADAEALKKSAEEIAEAARKVVIGEEAVELEEYNSNRALLVKVYGEESQQVQWLTDAYNKLHPAVIESSTDADKAINATEEYASELVKLQNTLEQLPSKADVAWQEYYNIYLKRGNDIGDVLKSLSTQFEISNPLILLSNEVDYQNKLLEEEKVQVDARIDLLEKYMSSEEFAQEHTEELEALKRQSYMLTLQTQENLAMKEKRILELRTREQAQAYGDIASILQAGADVSRENSGIQKGLAAASVFMSTWQSAQLAYASAFLPTPNVTSPYIGALSMAAAIATGLANLHQILSADETGKNISASASSGAAAVPQATILNADSYANVLSDTTFADLQMNAVENQKVYVVSSEISESQNSNKTVVTTSTF